MAVFTELSTEDFINLLSLYDFGRFDRAEGITQGVENTNYHLWTDTGRYIVTVLEGRTRGKDLAFYDKVTRALFDEGIQTPIFYRDLSGGFVQNVKGKSCVVSKYLEGASIEADSLRAEQVGSAGKLLAQCHVASASFDPSIVRNNQMGIEEWRRLIAKTGDKADVFEQGLSSRLLKEIDVIEASLAGDLPNGVIHGDYFTDNVFFDAQGDAVAVIDFYFSCTDTYVYDLALAVNAWCFDDSGEFGPDFYGCFVDSYQCVRVLSESEKLAFSMLRKAAALRIISTRLHDWFFTPADAMITKKDPSPYLKIFDFETSWFA